MGVLRDVARVPDVRRVEAGWALCLTGGMIATVALLIYAFTAGGAALVAAFAVSEAVVRAVMSSVGSSVGDRIRRDRLLRWTASLAAVFMALAAEAATAGASPGVAIALGVVSSGFRGSYRPLQAAILPWLVRTPAELTAANVTSTIMESTGRLIGPVIAGVVLLVSSSRTAIAVAALFIGLSWLSTWRLRLPDQSLAVPEDSGMTWRDVSVGAHAVWQVGRPGGLAVLAVAQTFARGVLTVALVVFALDVLRLGEDSVGWLNAAMGLGGLLGGVLAVTMVRITRLGRSFAAGIALWGVPLLLLAAVPTTTVAYLALIVIGVGNAFADGAMYTLLPRLVGARIAGRALGALELLVFAGLAAGSLAAPLLVAGMGPRGGFLVAGTLIVVPVVAYASRFARIDRTLPAPGPELDLLRGLPMFQHLPLVIVEQLTENVEAHEYQRGDVVMRQGEPGEQFHVVRRGSASVTVDGRPRPSLGAGDCFGEIALLRDIPRTATVIAGEDLATFVLRRSDFLSAVTGHQTSAEHGHALVRRRLAADPD